MAEKKTRFDGDAPVNPHMVVYHRPGQAMAVPAGAMIGVVMNPTRKDPHQRMVVVSVTNEVWTFKCTCNPTCTVQWTYRLVQERGAHSR